MTDQIDHLQRQIERHRTTAEQFDRPQPAILENIIAKQERLIELLEAEQ